MKMDDYVTDKIFHDILNSPTLLEEHKANPEKIAAYVDEKTHWTEREQVQKMYNMLRTIPELQSFNCGVAPLSEEDQLKYFLWLKAESFVPYARRKEKSEVQAAVNAIPLSQDITDFLDKLIANPLLGLLDYDKTYETIRSHRNDPVMTQKIVSIIEEILK